MILISACLCRVTLHGGYGWLSGRHGLAVDNLKQVGRLRYGAPRLRGDTERFLR